MDPQTLSALVASKLCHDLVSPVSALTTALGVLDDDASADMRDHAMGLIRTSTASLAAKLEFYRLALGAAALGDGDMDFSEVRRVAEGYAAQNKKIALVWNVGIARGPRAVGRMIPHLILIAIDCLARGGTVTVTAETTDAGVEVVARAEGDRAKLKDSARDGLSGKPPEGEMAARMVQPYLLYLGAATARADIRARESENRVEVVLRAAALTSAL